MTALTKLPCAVWKAARMTMRDRCVVDATGQTRRVRWLQRRWPVARVQGACESCTLLCDNNENRYPSVQMNIFHNRMIRIRARRFFTWVRPPASFREETRVSYWEYIPLRPPVLHMDILSNTIGAGDTYICVLRARHTGAMLMAYGWRQHHDHAWPPKTIQPQFRYSGRNSTVPG
jgi:hypothetical protein